VIWAIVLTGAYMAGVPVAAAWTRVIAAQVEPSSWNPEEEARATEFAVASLAMTWPLWAGVWVLWAVTMLPAGWLWRRASARWRR
jgi:hypothetical protein